MSEKKYYFKLSPELGDGGSCEIVERLDTPIFAEKVREWVENVGEEPGETFMVEVVEMTREEFEALPQL